MEQTDKASTAEMQSVERWFNSSKYEELHHPEIRIEPCVCGKLPSLHSSSGGFDYYDYYQCSACGLYATGFHEFPMGVYLAMSSIEKPKEPKLFVRQKGEHRAEIGWNQFISSLSK